MLPCRVGVRCQKRIQLNDERGDRRGNNLALAESTQTGKEQPSNDGTGKHCLAGRGAIGECLARAIRPEFLRDSSAVAPETQFTAVSGSQGSDSK